MLGNRQTDVRLILQVSVCAEKYDCDLLRDKCDQRLSCPDLSSRLVEARSRTSPPVKTRDRNYL
jgi:hypothetical protein